ncbi:fructose bisphosphate aldolase [Sphingomonas sp. LY160]|uniref:fructose bisphosphate aldolase n=1 Tax=Sphingomonas sp. LY160 TaxID=3095342 RepID=UPI002ADEEFB8|nr:fructose bisphosphate aldolase [Sphingomonas sp. LY160]MEA1071413.1 fructose bisphosphate aldolase [Sphingomonas sp. LY160]
MTVTADARRNQDAMREQIAKGQGFIAALDQSGGSTPGALKGYGIEADGWASDDEMFGLIHAMRERIITSPCFNGEKVIGAILFERTMDGEAGGKPVPDVLWERGVVPFLKVDKGLEDEADGVKLMKPIDGLGDLLDRAANKGVFGTKMRSVIERASPTGIAAVVAQQFEVAKTIIDHGLMPIIEPEVSIKSEDRETSDEILRDEILKHLDTLPEDRQVMLKLTIPAVAGTFDPLVDHPRVLRVVALSGGFSREEACAKLAQNRGMIASFSRALLSDLRHQMSDEEFDKSLGLAIDDIHAASVA